MWAAKFIVHLIPFAKRRDPVGNPPISSMFSAHDCSFPIYIWMLFFNLEISFFRISSSSFE
jgi:hypothetical protein